jgi:hypothetical protein
MPWGRTARRHKSHTHRVLKGKRAHVLKQVEAAATPSVSDPIDVQALHRLRASLQALHDDIRHDTGAGPRAAARALKDLDTSLAKLAAVNTSSPGAATQALLEEGLRALRSAHLNARKAGGDWPL